MATRIYVTTADSEMLLPTWPDIDGRRKPKMSATEPEVETGSGNNYERKDSNDLSYIFDHAKFKYDSADTDRHRPISLTQDIDENRK